MRRIIRQKLRGLQAVIHIGLFRSDTLVAGPYTGEFGIELLDWSGYVRKLGKRYRRVIVLSYPGNRCLYDPCEYYSHSLCLQDSGFGHGSLPVAEAKRILQDFTKSIGLDPPFDWFHSSHLNRLTRKLIGPQLFMDALPANRRIDFDIAFHFRSVHRAADPEVKNYAVEHASTLVHKCRAEGFRLCCIGHPAYALYLDGCVDLRSDELYETRRALETVRLVAGGSSGPMHFAVLCGLPSVVWFDRTNNPKTASAYLESGNPHRVPVAIASDATFQPDPERVFSEISRLLRRMEEPGRAALKSSIVSHSPNAILGRVDNNVIQGPNASE